MLKWAMKISMLADMLKFTIEDHVDILHVEV